MIYGIGADIVRIARMEMALERFGERFAQRILAEDELFEFRSAPRRAQFLAKHFAAKEALVKALGTGFRHGITLRQISVVHNAAGRPGLCCHGHLRVFMERVGAGEGLLSLADEDDYAIAFVTLMRQAGPIPG